MKGNELCGRGNLCGGDVLSGDDWRCVRTREKIVLLLNFYSVEVGQNKMGSKHLEKFEENCLMSSIYYIKLNVCLFVYFVCKSTVLLRS
jgi:hypothetical protein